MYTVYSKPNCQYCDKAKTLLTVKSQNYTEIIIDVGQPREDNKNYISLVEFKAIYPNIKTVPLVLNQNNDIIGGFQELQQLFV